MRPQSVTAPLLLKAAGGRHSRPDEGAERNPVPQSCNGAAIRADAPREARWATSHPMGAQSLTRRGGCRADSPYRAGDGLHPAAWNRLSRGATTRECSGAISLPCLLRNFDRLVATVAAPKPGSRPTSATTRRSRRINDGKRKWRLGHYAAVAAASDDLRNSRHRIAHHN